VTEQRATEFRKRIGITVLYGIICAYEVWAFVSILTARRIVMQPSYWTIAIDAYCAYVCWSMLGQTQRKTERLAALLMALLFVIKIGMRFIEGQTALALRGVGCAFVVAGAIVMMTGLIRARSHKELESRSTSN
jgi:hypothetical protein